jgi:hypothetical protein
METKSQTNRSENQWYYVQGGRRIGPVTRESLLYLFREQSMSTETLVWCPTLVNWQPANATSLAKELPSDNALLSGTPVIPNRGPARDDPHITARWYYVENERTKGPIFHKALYHLLSENKLPPHTPVRFLNSTRWRPAQNIFPITNRNLPEPPKLPIFWAAKAKEVPELKKTSVILVIFLTFITVGIYTPIWYLSRFKALNSLQSAVKLNRGILIAALVLTIFTAFLDIGVEFAYYLGELLLDAGVIELSQMLELLKIIDQIEDGNALITIPLLLFTIYYAFRAKRILQDHYQGYLDQKVSFNGAAVFFLQNFYLQFKINRLV